jgi:membrane protein
VQCNTDARCLFRGAGWVFTSAAHHACVPLRTGTWALTLATNIAYHQEERRGYLKLMGLAVLFTFAAVIGLLVVLGLAVVVPLVLKALPLGAIATITGLVLRWVLLWGFAVLALALLYRYAPVSGESEVALGQLGIGHCSHSMACCERAVQPLCAGLRQLRRDVRCSGGAVLLLVWFYLGSFAVLLGAELDAEMEHQTKVDTTSGRPQPMGKRGAFVADTLGQSPR